MAHLSALHPRGSPLQGSWRCGGLTRPHPQQQLSLPRAGQHTSRLSPSQRLLRTRTYALSSSSSSSTPEYSSSSSQSSPEGVVPLGDGDAIRALPISRKALGPSFDLDASGALNVQLKVLKHNDKPHFDHGIEVMYRFANFDPFQRSHYFGKSFDLGQFERFRRIMHIPAYAVLLNHESHTVLSTLQVAERVWKARVHVTGDRGHEEATYEWTLHQRLGGPYDGFWYTDSLVADGHDWKALNITF